MAVRVAQLNFKLSHKIAVKSDFKQNLSKQKNSPQNGRKTRPKVQQKQKHKQRRKTKAEEAKAKEKEKEAAAGGVASVVLRFTRQAPR